MRRRCSLQYQAGFTLIELSIVLVIIGLIAGGVLVGQELIRAAAVRSTLTQLEKFNAAVNTFRGKYGAIPGDMNPGTAASYGFVSRSGQPSQGDGNGVLEGWNGSYTVSGQCIGPTGEEAMFWSDLTYANGMNINLIEGSFNSAAFDFWAPCNDTPCAINSILPEAKIGRGNYWYTWSQAGFNYFGMSVLTTGISAGGVTGPAAPGLTVTEAYNIDKKIDDGYPQTGAVIAYAIVSNGGGGFRWAMANSLYGATPGTSSTFPSPQSCYDNGGNNGVVQQYSTGYQGGTALNCALSFRFQ